MKKLFNAYRFLNILSIDVAGGAVICALFFAKIFSVFILPYGLISLGLTVWVIYTADHLVDARRAQQPAATERHRFHQQHFKLLIVLLVVVVIVDCTQLFFIRKIVFIQGLGLATAIVIYFLLQRYLKFLKEVIGSLLYCCGVLLIPLSLKNESLNYGQLVLIVQFAITALINLLLFSWFDKSQDEQDRHSSFATTLGVGTTKIFLTILFSVQTILTFVQFVDGELRPVLVLVLMNTLLLLIFIKREYFEADDRYRLLGDAVFFVPMIYVFI